MGKTIITVGCIDQRLVIVSAPVLASGGRNEDEMLFEFCSLWDGFTKTAVFYRTEDEVFHAKVTNDKCVIPHEVLTSEGWLYFGVFGVKGDITRTSEVIRYKVTKGALTDGTKPSDPTPDIYAQILAEVGTIENRTSALEACLTQPETYSLTGGLVQLDNFADMPMDCTADSAEGTTVTITRCGKNLIPYPYSTPGKTVNGVTYIIDADGTIRANGTLTDATIGAGITLHENNKLFTVKAGRWRFICEGVKDISQFYPVLYQKTASGAVVVANTRYNRYQDFTAETDLENCYVFLASLAGYPPSNETVRIMLVSADETDLTYEPYRGETYIATPGETITIPALAGLNVLYTDGDSLTVSGRKDVFALTRYLAERIKVLEETVATLSAAAVES